MLTRGRIHVEVMPEDWSPTSTGMGIFVQKLPGILKRMLGPTAAQPKVLYSDRGSNMYTPRAGIALGPYAAAVEAAGFRLYQGPDASRQPSDLADILLHETAISCFRKALNRAKPSSKPWKETWKAFCARVRGVVREANKNCEFDRLCCEYPTRLELLKEKEGDRLRK